MFESITLTTHNKHDSIKPLDIGLLVECMLFYGKTTVIANYHILDQLFRYFGGDKLLILIKEEFLKIVYTESWLGVITNTENNIQYHGVTPFSSPQHQFQNELRKICIQIQGADGKGRRLARKIQNYIQVKQHDPLILKGATESFLNQRYIESSAQLIINELLPEIKNSSPFEFKTSQTNKGIEIETNLNFTEINRIYHRRVDPKHSSISQAFILSHLLTLEEELYFASSHLSELACSNLSARLGTNKIDYLIAKSKKSSQQLENFKDNVFSEVKSIREAVNTNQIDLDALITVLEKSRRFKKWIIGVPSDANLFKSYHDEITRGTFFESLPGKMIKLSLFTGLGTIAENLLPGGALIGISLGALDTFLFDKLVAGWKPNQFINDCKSIVPGKDDLE
jgi:hypothetical protein